MERVDPFAPVSSLDDETLDRVLVTAREQLQANAARRARPAARRRSTSRPASASRPRGCGSTTARAGRATAAARSSRSSRRARSCRGPRTGARAARRPPASTPPRRNPARAGRSRRHRPPSRVATASRRRGLRIIGLCASSTWRSPPRPSGSTSLWPFTERLERFGLAGFGWGATWLDGGRQARARIATSGRSGTTRRGARSARRDPRAARPPAPAIEVLHDRPAGHAAVRRPGGPLLVQPQRRPRAPRGVPDAVPRGRPHPRQGRHGGRRALARGRVGTRRLGPARLRKLHETFGGHANLAVLTRARARPTTTPATTRTPSSRSTSVGHPAGVHRACTRSIARSSSTSRPEATNRRLVRPRHRADPHSRLIGASSTRTAHPCAGRRGRTGMAVSRRRAPATRIEGADSARARRTACRSASSSSSRCTGWASTRSGAASASSPRSGSQLAPAGQGGSYLALTGWLMLPVVLLVQPTVGVISDYTISRWGRRKPYIVDRRRRWTSSSSSASPTSQTYVSVLAFLVLLQFSSNFAQGPFQGYVPDLVPRAAGRPRERPRRRDADDRLRDRERS